ncbi:aldose 1-epimerase family protein [Defluviitalea raffinosedens]|jgi:galactose mutarotase-like enzyme|uniref:Aldose 1-epimerase family protein n=1 Tax=Defluviitalea raffinosedens TaxID=1450156 RepID=A0A7C8HHY0_9FIRM|nr:aldose 1-epimerase family protein [Defluviitalea raffinosedens]KAE9633779.1 aldose 1-epimerase family protein [Defluviitalea raffinosedens]MBM7686124.1 galactose mutarotase-like enzyme [Defluviitalea raffinosedens]MBZ4668035.1 aldose 1-epimerase family protein [Defluviitaleaceae bacterium]HHW68553.1 aldose 1-epimerase family protein [Candidatus Epulonipiscium sp.]
MENQWVKVKTKPEGAELTSIILKEDHTEYLWQGDHKIWGRHAPILFPIVGRLNDNKYTIDGNEYRMTQHGFARDMIFDILEESEEHILYQLTSNENTLKHYPYHFQLRVEYILAKKSIIVKYFVKNTDVQKIYFSIGGHPGFNCPLIEGERMEDYVLEFEKEETLDKICLEDGLISEEKQPFLNHEKIIPITKDLFANDALIVENTESRYITLKSIKSTKAIRVTFDEFRYLGIWSKPEGAPFICIEPWLGIADYKNNIVDFKEKAGILSIDPDEEFACSYTISIQ